MSQKSCTTLKHIHCYRYSNWAPFSVIQRCTLSEKLPWTFRRVSGIFNRLCTWTIHALDKLRHAITKQLFAESTVWYYWKWCSIWALVSMNLFSGWCTTFGTPCIVRQNAALCGNGLKSNKAPLFNLPEQLESFNC